MEINDCNNKKCYILSIDKTYNNISNFNFHKNMIDVYDLQQCICNRNGITCIITDCWYSKSFLKIS